MTDKKNKNKGKLISFDEIRLELEKQAKEKQTEKSSKNMGDINQLIAGLELAIEQEPDNASLYIELSDSLAQIGEQESAIHLLEYYLDEIDDDKPEIILALANKFLLVSDYNFAYIFARKIIIEYPQSSLVDEAEEIIDYLLVQVEEDLDFPFIFSLLKYDKEYEILKIETEDALAQDPDNLDAKNYYALAIRQLGRQSESLVILDEIIKKDPNNIMAHAELARIYLDQKDEGNFKKTIQHLERLVPIQDKDTVQLAEALSEFGRDELVYDHLKRLIKQKKYQENDKILFAYGVAAANNGEYTEAMAAFEKFAQLNNLVDTARYYSYLMRQVIAGKRTIGKLSYNNLMPYMEFMGEQKPEDEANLTPDFAYSHPLVYDSLVWMLHEGTDFFKADAIRLLSFLMTADVEKEFKKFLLAPQADDALKMYVMTELYDNEIYGPYEVMENNKKTLKTNYQVAFMTLQWREDWVQVMMNVKESFEPLPNRQSLLEKAHQQWVEFLAPQQKTFDIKLDVPAWSAALAYYAYSDYSENSNRDMIARTFGTDVDAMMGAFGRLTAK